jgi:hypothetical protein
MSGKCKSVITALNMIIGVLLADGQQPSAGCQRPSSAGLSRQSPHTLTYGRMRTSTHARASSRNCHVEQDAHAHTLRHRHCPMRQSTDVRKKSNRTIAISRCRFSCHQPFSQSKCGWIEIGRVLFHFRKTCMWLSTSFNDFVKEVLDGKSIHNIIKVLGQV